MLEVINKSGRLGRFEKFASHVIQWWGWLSSFFTLIDCLSFGFLVFLIFRDMSRFNNIAESSEVETDMALRTMKDDMAWIGDREILDFQEEENIGRLSAQPQDLSTVLRVFPSENNDESSSKISGMMESLHLPTDMMSFALTYEKAYCSSVVMDFWSIDRTLPRIDIPIRMRHKSKAKFECLTWFVL